VEKLTRFEKLLIVLAFVALAVGWCCNVREHRIFTRTFGVAAPYYMDRVERATLQQVVTRKLTELGATNGAAKRKLCSNNGMSCVEQRDRLVASSQKDLNKARFAALFFGFTVPAPICGDGKYPINGKCSDGSNPVQ